MVYSIGNLEEHKRNGYEVAISTSIFVVVFFFQIRIRILFGYLRHYSFDITEKNSDGSGC